MERKLLFLINPVAGTKPKNNLEKYLVDRSHQAGITCMVTHSTRISNAASIQAIAQHFNATDIIACGGDGTVNLAAETAVQTNIPLGIIPVGSGNGLARSANIPLKPSKAFDTIIAGHTSTIDTFTINKQFGLLLTGMGLDGAVAERFAQKDTRGLITYTTQTLLEYFKAQPYQFKIQLPDFEFFTDAFFICVANSNQFGNNVTIAPKASLSDGLLDIVIVQKMPKTELPFALLKQIRGNNKLQVLADTIGKQNVIYFQTPKITISNLGHAPMHIDGDPANYQAKVDFAINKDSLQLITPA